MAAALARRRSDEGAVQPTRLARDLYQIAELVEICFQPTLDSGGRAAIHEMKWVGRLGPLLWPLSLFGDLGLGHGFVWRAGGRVVGNVSLHQGGRHPTLGRGSLIANVAVHPDWRRQGIARELMDAALDLARRSGSRWVALQVEADNSAARRLYETLGFETFEPLSHWESDTPLPVSRPREIWSIRPRVPADAQAEIDLIFRRARRGAMLWTQSLTRQDIGEDFLGDFAAALNAQIRDRAVMPDPRDPQRLLGSLWIEMAGWRLSRLALFLDPALEDTSGRQSLLWHALESPALAGRSLRIETVSGDAPVEDLLVTAGFRCVRTLVQMRLNLS